MKDRCGILSSSGTETTPNQEAPAVISFLYALCVMMLSALAGVHPDVVDATAVDGASPAQVARVTVTVLYDNNALQTDLRSDHGFACLVEGFEKTVLFDTGRSGDILLANMRVLGVDPGDVDAVILSHAHEDHTGGLAALLAHNPDVAVYFPASFPADFVRSVRAAGATPLPVETRTSLCAGLTLTAPLGGPIAEIGLVAATAQGAVLITGCAHPGIAIMAGAATEIAGGPLLAVLGGFHLTDSSPSQVRSVIQDLRPFGIEGCGPAHCTGDAATALMRETFADDFMQMFVGAVVEF